MQNISDLSSSGRYYVSPELCCELRHIDNGVNHIHLDHAFLKNERWQQMCDPATVFVHKQGEFSLFCVTVLYRVSNNQFQNILYNDNDNDRWLGLTPLANQPDYNYYNKIKSSVGNRIKFAK